MSNAVKSWMAWEGGVDLIGMTQDGLAQPNLIVHMARVVHFAFQRFFEMAAGERRLAAGALLEDAFRFDMPLVCRYGLDFLILLTKPRHMV